LSPGDFGTPVSFFWKLHPALVGFLVFAIDFGVIMLIRRVREGRFYWERWWSFRIGDTIGLPVFAGFAAVVVSDSHFSGFYIQTWWHISAFVGGYLLAGYSQVKNLRTGLYSWQEITCLSEIYHTVVMGVMFYLVSTAIVAVGADREPVWATILAFTGLSVWILGVVIDGTSLVDKTPGRKYR
jgi:hypothetical protein